MRDDNLLIFFSISMENNSTKNEAMDEEKRDEKVEKVNWIENCFYGIFYWINIFVCVCLVFAYITWLER